jgi:hypothetical protein
MKLSKIISLLLVPLLLFALALPAYADGGSESYLIYFETGGGTGVPIIASTNLDGNLTSLPSPATLSRAGTPTSWTAIASRPTPSSPRMAPSTPTGVPSQRVALPPCQSPRRTRLRRTKASPSEHTPGHFLSPGRCFSHLWHSTPDKDGFYDSDVFAHPARRLPPALPC